jgi:hypothetical protein
MARILDINALEVTKDVLEAARAKAWSSARLQACTKLKKSFA